MKQFIETTNRLGYPIIVGICSPISFYMAGVGNQCVIDQGNVTLDSGESYQSIRNRLNEAGVLIAMPPSGGDK